MTIDRRSILTLCGAAALTATVGPVLAGCDGSGTADVGNAGKDLAPWPDHVPFAGPTPDAPGDANGVQPLYLRYPQQTVASVTDTVGDGSEVTALVVSFGAPPKPAAQNRLWAAVNKALNVNLKLVVVPDPEYAQKMTTLMAGTDVPDIIMFTNLTLPHAAEFIQATCADLSELVGAAAIRQYPNLANLPPYAWRGMGRIGGRIYGIPLERPLPANSLFVNRPALEAVGAPRDWTAEQYLAAMRKLTGGRRWGTGSTKAQFGGLGAVTYHAGSMGAPNTWAQGADGAFTHTITTEQFTAALEMMRKVAEAKAYHPDSLTASSTDMKNHFYNGTVASMTDGFGSLAPQTLTAINGRFALDLARPYSAQATPWRGGGLFGYVAFRKAAPDRLKLLLRIVNYLSAPFGTREYELANFGVEGVHFTRTADGIRTTPLFAQENNTSLPIKYLGVAPAVLHLPGHPEVARAAYEWEKAVLPRSVPNPATGLRSPTQAAKGAQLDQIIGDGVAAVVTGREPLSSWPATVTRWRQAGGDRLAEEMAREHAAAR